MSASPEAILEKVDSQIHAVSPSLDAGLLQLDLQSVFGRKLGRLMEKHRSDGIVELLLRADVLRVTFICLYADGKLSTDETEAVFPLISKLANQLAKVRPETYSSFSNVTTRSVNRFFRTYWKDSGPFGFTCQQTKWRGLRLCHEVDRLNQHERASRGVGDCLLTLAKQLARIDGIDDRSRPSFERLIADLKTLRNGPEVNENQHQTSVVDDGETEPSDNDGQPLNDAEFATEGASWTVSIAGRQKVGVKRSGLQASAARGELGDSAFLRAEDGSTDWVQATTCDWLFDAPAAWVGRYCRECLARVQGTPAILEQNPKCPNCHRPTAYIDFLKTSATLDEIGVEPWGLLDWLTVATTVVFLFVSFSCGIAFFVTDSVLPVLLSFIFLVGGSSLFVYSSHQRSQAIKYQNHLLKVDSAFSERTAQLGKIAHEKHLLQHNIERIQRDLVDETKGYCLQQELEANDALAEAQHQAGTVQRVSQRYLDEQRKWWTQKLRGDNYQVQRGRIEKAIKFVEKESFRVSDIDKRAIFQKLKHDYEMRVRKEAEMDRQRRAKAQLRAEQKAEREAKEALARAEAERTTIQEALDEALARAGAEHSVEVEQLQRQLQEAVERGQRAVSQAQLTKVGHVYVISNIGCFGEDVFKVGLTRREEPEVRIKELSGASVPFPFDVHMMIYSEDAPALEHTLHNALHEYRVNRVNFRKEFFRVDIDTIHKAVLEHHGELDYYIADAEALQYMGSLEISDEDFTFLEGVAESQGIDFESDED